ncbi:hypothetical protein HMPREF1624_07813 [Sporothrix schenckii ATCC 58251]|uniref:C2H2-type domain-containing protein n=1 Tax=Sporothrix schenckii (strain ATCC 58251 / de Perez 2211183) TaxID=1391915 RepID=U7PJB5_SPOS1|nr:hypothetical protein HMPREF1624_07813 [Sporothrix schenckii ATCC 58251]
MEDDDEKLFQCFECADGVQIFATEEALITHKWDMIRTTKRMSHMSCHVCKLDHRTFEGLVRHYQLNHPVKQQLHCPGCRALFTRLHALMHHLDNDDCPHIRASRVKESRALQVQATNLLASAAAQAALDGGGGSVRDDGGFNVNAESAVDGVVAPDAVASRETQLGIFNHSGVTVGDFGTFINIDPREAAAVAAESKLETVRTTTASGIRGNLVNRSENNGHAVPPTSALASEALLLKRQRNMGVGGILDRKGKGKGKAKADKDEDENEDAVADADADGLAVGAGADMDRLKHRQVVRDFRHGDSKAPDLLTDDHLNAVHQRFQGLSVWAGQTMLKPEAATHHGHGSDGPGGHPAPATKPAPRGTPANPGPALGAGLANLANLAGIAGLSSRSNPDEVKAAVASWRAAARAGMGARDLGGGDGGDILAHAMDNTSPRTMGITIHHPDHPNFSVYRYENKANRRFNCPYPSCQSVGKLFKTAGGLIGHLRSETAHSKVRVQCPSCFVLFETVNALMQHCESQSSRCQFRESDDYIPFLNILSAGAAEIHGRNVDMTLSYDVQEGAARMLLMDDGQDTESQADSQVYSQA